MGVSIENLEEIERLVKKEGTGIVDAIFIAANSRMQLHNELIDAVFGEGSDILLIDHAIERAKKKEG